MARKPKQDLEQTPIADATKNTNGNEAGSQKTSQPLTAEQESAAALEAAKFADAGYRSRCGGALRLAREKQGLSTRDVANQLRLSPKQVEAIESDNFAALPEPTIVKGFIRNYARLLKMPVEPLLDAYLVLVPNKTQHSLTIHPASGMRLNNSGKSPGSRRYFLMLLAVLLAVGLWFFYQVYIQKPSPVLPTTELKEPLPEAALPMAERNNPADEGLPSSTEPNTPLDLPKANTVDPGTSISGQTPSDSPEAATAAPADPMLKTSPTVSTNENPTAEKLAIAKDPTNAMLSRLEFSASQETWVSVVDASGKEVYNKVLFSGNREVVEAKPPLNIVVGNSHGATLTVNNQAVDLAPHTRINVARLRID